MWLCDSLVSNFGYWLSAAPVSISDPVKKILISQLIYDISRVCQKLFKYFNVTVIWTSFDPSFPIWPVIFCLDLNEALSGSSATSVITPLLLING